MQFGASTYTATEGGAAATVTVSLNQPAFDELAIPITATPRGTTEASDYSVGGLNADGALVFALGAQTRTLTVTANVDADAVAEAVVLGFGGVVPPGAILVAGKWFDWGGGLTWGYRSIVETTPFLTLLMIPIIERVIAGRVTRVVFGALLIWSVGVQFVGSWSYSAVGWDTVTKQHDDPSYASVWMWSRPQIGYHLVNFAAERAQKKSLMSHYASKPKRILILRD